MEDITEYITQEATAELLFCSTAQIRKMREKGLICGTRFGKRWIYKRTEIIRFREKSFGKDFRNYFSSTAGRIA